MDPMGDHASICKKGFGVVHRHNSVCNAFARHVLRPAGLAYSLEVPFLLPNSSRRPADILVQPTPPRPGERARKPTAYDITVRSPYIRSNIYEAAQSFAGAAELADKDKLRKHQQVVRNVQLANANRLPTELDWTFVPLAFDTLGAPSARTRAVIEEHAIKIAFRTPATPATIKLRLQQRLSYVVWSSVAAAAILARMPSQDVEASFPLTA